MEIDLLSLSRVSVDAECLRDVKPPYSFGASQFLGNAVTCTVTGGGEYKDWIGDQSIMPMLNYIMGFDIIITYNGIGFDYALWGGSMLGPENALSRTAFKNALKGKSVDLCLDFKETLGKRVRMNDVADPTLGDAKEMDGGFAPQHWRAGRCLEVITYCRGDVRRTDGLFVKAAGGEDLLYRMKDGTERPFKCTPKLR